MKIEPKRVKIADLVRGYENDEESGEVIAYADKSGKAQLNIRPKYQREFVYKPEQQEAVIDTIMKGNSIYWVKNAEKSAEREFEVLDGQQRIISICEYHKGNFSHNAQLFHNLAQDTQEKFLGYELMVYVCDGGEQERLDWFKVINIAGEKLTDQELRNINYTSAWLSDAKRKFSKNNCLADQKASKYLKGSSIRQEYLETALAWRQNSWNERAICEYMSKHAKDSADASELWEYFEKVIDWVEKIFPKYRAVMKGVEWGLLYNEFGEINFKPDLLESEVAELMKNSEIQKKSGIYEYLLSGKEREKCLNLRVFDENTKIEVFEEQGGICKSNVSGFRCPNKGKVLNIKQMEADHIIPWSEGGRTEKDNCQMLCKECNGAKSNK